MRPPALAAALLCLAAFAPEAEAQGDSTTHNPFRYCVEQDSAKEAYPRKADHRAWTVWDLCLDQVTYRSRWSEFEVEEIYDYLIAAEAADWGKAASKECTLDQGIVDAARKKTMGMLANALATRGGKGLAIVPTYLARVAWGETWWREEFGGLT